MRNRAKVKRSQVVAVKLTPEERAEVEARARKARIATGAYVRQQLFANDAEPQLAIA